MTGKRRLAAGAVLGTATCAWCDLRVVRRVLGDGSYQNSADEMRKSGLARRYLGGVKSGWC